MENSKSANKGTFLWRLSKKFQFAADKLIPDSFVFCLILTFIVFVLGIIFTETGPVKMVIHWYIGLWTKMTFAFKMAFMVVTCAVCAQYQTVTKVLRWVEIVQKTPMGQM